MAKACSVMIESQFLSPATLEAANGALDELRESAAPALETHQTSTVRAAIETIVEPTRFDYLPGSVLETIRSIEQEHGPIMRGRYLKFVVLELIGAIDGKVAKLGLPASIRAFLPETLDVLVADIVSVADNTYLTSTNLFRELRLASLRSIRCGARIIDNSTFVPKTIYRYNGIVANLRCLYYVYAKLGGLQPLFRTHVDSRFPKGFDEAGNDASYLRIAELLRQHPHIRGTVGTSWFYDPQLERVSPHLAYLRTRPLERGAFLRYDGPGDIHTKNALATSKTRRQLYEAGDYVPTGYTMLWARSDILRWAKKVA